MASRIRILASVCFLMLLLSSCTRDLSGKATESLLLPCPSDTPYDVNLDGIADCNDLQLIASHLDEGGAVFCDPNGDNKISTADFFLVADALYEESLKPSECLS